MDSTRALFARVAETAWLVIICVNLATCTLVSHSVFMILLLAIYLKYASPIYDGGSLCRDCARGNLHEVSRTNRRRAFDVNWVCEDAPFTGLTPLAIACQEGHEEVVKYLLAAPGICVNRGHRRDSPLILALQSKNLKVVRILLEDFRVDCFIPKHLVPTDINYPELVVAAGRGVQIREAGSRFYIDFPDESRHCYPQAFGITPEEADFWREMQEPLKACKLFRKKLGWTSLESQLLSTILFTSEGLLRMKEGGRENTQRFYRIASVLPLEIQMILANRISHSPLDLVPAVERERAARELADHYLFHSKFR